MARKKSTASAAEVVRGMGVAVALSDLGAYGQANAVSARRLCRALGVALDCGRSDGNGSGELLRRRVGEARDAGFVIGSGPTGYYLPDGDHETLVVIGRLESRAMALLKRASAMRETLIAEVA